MSENISGQMLVTENIVGFKVQIYGFLSKRDTLCPFWIPNSIIQVWLHILHHLWSLKTFQGSKFKFMASFQKGTLRPFWKPKNTIQVWLDILYYLWSLIIIQGSKFKFMAFFQKGTLYVPFGNQKPYFKFDCIYCITCGH